MSFTRARLLATFAFCVATGIAFTDTKEADASVSLAVPFETLLRTSTAASMVTPIDAKTVWEDGRIYTYTRVNIDRAVAGTLGAGDQPWVRSMGGVVGNIGQVVDGEPVLTIGRSALLFVHDGPAGAMEVTARAQGLYPVVAAQDNTLKIIRNAHAGVLIANLRPLQEWKPELVSTPTSTKPRFAADVLHNRAIDDAVNEVSAVWSRTHAL